MSIEAFRVHSYPPAGGTLPEWDWVVRARTGARLGERMVGGCRGAFLRLRYDCPGGLSPSRLATRQGA
jgi:hypothetical protein